MKAFQSSAPAPAGSITRDLDAIFEMLNDNWPRLKGARLFITGGTGLIGRWMTEALCLANDRLALGMEMVILSRDPAAFAARAPHLSAQPCIRFVTGDIAQFDAPDGDFTHVIHGATDASAHLNEHDPRRMFDTIVGGTRTMLDFALERAAGKFLFLSSGAVYGPQPWDITHAGEDHYGGPDCRDPRSAYGEGKRAAEMLCAIYTKQFGLDIATARIFALLGPLLSLDIHFAAGNFIRDVLAGRAIRIEGAGTAVRSYLYIADVTAWLLSILLHGKAGSVYNVGSEESVSIAELAARTSDVLGGREIEILGKADPGWNAGRYVPSTKKIRRELGVTPSIGLDEAIRRTAIWNGWKHG